LVEEISQEEMVKNMDFLQQLFDKIAELNRKNNLLKNKYGNDPKFARIHKRIVENGEIVIRPMMYLALSYDHRIIDGKQSVLFLRTIKELLEDPAKLLLDL
jgi:hypothetical protein